MRASSQLQARIRVVAALGRNKKWVACGLLLVLSAVLFRPGQRIWSGWRTTEARELCNRASSLMAEGHYDEGISMMRRAYQIEPGDPLMLRTLARSCDLKTQAASTAVSFWNKLVDSGAASPDDHIELAKAMLASGDATGAREVLVSLPPQVRRQPNCAEVEAALLREEGRDKDADILLRSVWECHPDDPDCRLKLARADYFSPFDATRDEAAKKLWTIARSREAQAADAVIALLSGPDGGVDAVAEIRQIVRDNPQIKPADRLGILGLCARKFPVLATAIIDEESSRFSGKPPVSCVELYEWLSRLGDSDRILRDLSNPPSKKAPADAPVPPVPSSVVFQSRELFLAYGDALILKGHWQVFAGLLQHANLPVTRIDEELMRALCSCGLNEPETDIDRHLAAALTFAQHQPDQDALLRVAMTAERIGRLKTAIEARSMITCASQRLRLENLVRIHRLQVQLGDVDGIMAAAESILEIRPGLKPYDDDLKYLKLLTGTGMESVLDELRKRTRDRAGAFTCACDHPSARSLSMRRAGGIRGMGCFD